ncbi:hypothetical protein [Paraglaciecola sp. L1A13]|nr:hypothetical protein [Paraglaciecola sp. L1A13]
MRIYLFCFSIATFACMSEGYIMGADKPTHALANILLEQYTQTYLLKK